MPPGYRGGVSERPKEHASKACVGASPPWVQIPPPPPCDLSGDRRQTGPTVGSGFRHFGDTVGSLPPTARVSAWLREVPPDSAAAGTGRLRVEPLRGRIRPLEGALLTDRSAVPHSDSRHLCAVFVSQTPEAPKIIHHGPNVPLLSANHQGCARPLASTASSPWTVLFREAGLSDADAARGVRETGAPLIQPQHASATQHDTIGCRSRRKRPLAIPKRHAVSQPQVIAASTTY